METAGSELLAKYVREHGVRPTARKLGVDASTLSRLARSIGSPSGSMAILFETELNIEYGAWYEPKPHEPTGRKCKR